MPTESSDSDHTPRLTNREVAEHLTAFSYQPADMKAARYALIAKIPPATFQTWIDGTHRKDARDLMDPDDLAALEDRKNNKGVRTDRIKKHLTAIRDLDASKSLPDYAYDHLMNPSTVGTIVYDKLYAQLRKELCGDEDGKKFRKYPHDRAHAARQTQEQKLARAAEDKAQAAASQFRATQDMTALALGKRGRKSWMTTPASGAAAANPLGGTAVRTRPPGQPGIRRSKSPENGPSSPSYRDRQVRSPKKGNKSSLG